MAGLIIKAGTQAGTYFRLGRRTMAGGRDPAREIQITDPKVSRKHFIIRADRDKHVIAETHAKNGIYVNGVQQTEATLSDGDEILVGDTLLCYLADDDVDRSDAVNKFRAGHRSHREEQTLGEGF